MPVPGADAVQRARPVFLRTEVFFVVSVAQERQRYAVCAERRLDDIRHIAGVRLRVEIGEVLAGMLLMAGEVIVRKSAMPQSSPQSNGNRYSISVVALE